ncbi:thioredoxin family protein [Pseudomonas sp. M30-35]|uniref:DUF1223 domain-containing protein n=1 Tax=Pseudomonas sp. M30-35 TaxID=1981174 RepID=UPI000B3D0ED5|nr:DUF1223 domain-containing protein [Pseudomonas sp. M30-35]ARU88376.1 hypothetical protein B9K09_10555 [Pseudomonas sp. M30-35]
MKKSWQLLPAAMLLATTVAHASALTFTSKEQPTSVLELYTSQGCSSCPPAEKWLSSLTQSPDLWKKVIPLAFHVDYWDYLGWQDPFANKNYSARQRAYTRSGRTSSVYTPGFVVAGHEWRGWYKNEPLHLPTQQKAVGKLQLTLDDNNVKVAFEPKQAPPKGLTLYVARLGFAIDTQITKGENAGKTIKHDFVVLSLQQVSASSSNHWRTKLHKDPRGERQAVVAWLGVPGVPAPYQAVGGWISQ